MTTRMTSKTVIFAHPFVVNEVDGEQPPGIYTVEIEEELLDTVSIPAYRRVSTVMHCHSSSGVTRFVSIDPHLLTAALTRDARAAN